MANSDFPFRQIGRKGTWQCLAIDSLCDGDPLSDGDQKCWPAKPYRPSSEEGHYIELGEKWAEALGIKEPGVNYYVDKLPNGYAAFEVPQSSNSSVAYKRLFGHSTGRYYDSAVKFTVHFLWLMSGMAGNCQCVLCGDKKIAPPVHRKRADLPKPSMRPTRNLTQVGESSTRDSSATGIAAQRTRREKQSGGFYAVDEEGTEDIYKTFLQKLFNAQDSIRGIDFDCHEENSLDWRSEHEYNGLGQDLLLASLTQVEQQHTFIPRVGEIVLWSRDFVSDHYLMLNNATSQYMYYSFEQKTWHGFPEWRAGVITTVPSKTSENGPVDFTDILDTPKKITALNTAGFRVETLPDSNDPLNKSASKQYRCVPLKNIRPLSHWQILLRKVPEKYLHPSIKYALTLMTSISLVEKFKAVGQWNYGKVLCKGVYLGAELITVGEVVRIASSSSRCTDVMIVDSIRLNLEEMKPEHVQSNSPYLCSKSYITFVGTTYTILAPSDRLDDETSMTPSPVPLENIKTLFRPVGSAEYGIWYQAHRLEVSYDQVLGRLYEADAVRLWTGQLQHKLKRGGGLPTHKPSLSFDVAGILSGRNYATKTDGRIPEPTSNNNVWFWADTRAEALGIETFNGIEVGKYDSVRTDNTLKSWNASMAVLNGRQLTSEASKYVSFTNLKHLIDGGSGGVSRGRRPGTRVVNGKVVYPGDPEYPVDGQQVGEEERGELARLAPVRSAMQDAAFASTDEEESDDVDQDHPERMDGADEPDDDDGNGMLQQFIRKATLAAKPVVGPKPVMSKADIMESIEGAGEFDNDVSEEEDGDEEETWLNEPLPPARGGTEESENGDYNPEHSQQRKTKVALMQLDDSDSE